MTAKPPRSRRPIQLGKLMADVAINAEPDVLGDGAAGAKPALCGHAEGP